MEGTAEERLRERLTSLYDELPHDEKALLLALLVRADGAEVSGFTFDLSAVSLLGPNVESGFDVAPFKGLGLFKATHDKVESRGENTSR
jgi:hypothetical protein